MADEMASRESIRRVKKRIEKDLLGLANVHAVDIGEKITKGKPTGELSIVVYVDKKKDVGAKNKVPEVVDGIKTDVQEQEPDVLHPVLARVASEDLMVDATRYTTLEGGMSMGPCRAIYMAPPDVAEAGYYITVGTLGAIVRDRTTHDPMALTNFHVAAVDDTWSAGDGMAQPARNDGGSCPVDRFGSLQRGVLSSNVDGAVVSIDSRPQVCEILEIGEVTGTRTATVGMAVRKRGRTTGLTHGQVISTDYTTTIPYGDGLGSVTLVDQIRISVSSPDPQFGTNGDSGSAVVDDDCRVVGLYFAGNSSGTLGVANPIAKVLSELDVEVCVTAKLLKEDKEWLKDHKLEKLEFKEWLKDHKPEKAEIKEWLKWEKSEKERPEKLDFEGGGKLFGEKAAPFEKDPRVEKDFRSEKYARIEKGFVEQSKLQDAMPSPGAMPSLSAIPGGEGSSPSDPFAPPLKSFFDKPFPEVVKDPKEWIKDKQEWKDAKNEYKEIKDSKDHKEKEVFEIPPGRFEFGRGQRFQREMAGGHAFHFIPSHLRPDLGRGALRNEGI